MNLRRVAGIGALALFGICLALGLSEMALRLSGLRRQFASAHPVVGYVLTPSFSRVVPITDAPAHTVELRTNNLGLRRDTDTQPHKPAGMRRVLLLGDSQSEGIVDNADTYAALLEKQLGADRVEVLNGAVSGYSPLLEWLWWKERGVSLTPDTILLTLYSGNDLAELLMHSEDFGGFGPTFRIPFLQPDGDSFMIELPGEDGGWLQRGEYLLRSHSRLYALMRRVMPRQAPPPSVFGAVATRCAGCLQSMWQAQLMQKQPRQLEEATARLAFILDELRRDTQRRGIDLVIAVLPTKLQVEPESMAAEVSAAQQRLELPEDHGAFDARVHAALIALNQAQAITTVDLLPPLRAAHSSSGKEMYWRQDWHINPAGHAAVAQALLSALPQAFGDPGGGSMPALRPK